MKAEKVEKFTSDRKVNLSEKLVASMLSYGGSLDKLSEDFEERPGQIKLSQAITRTFNEDSIGVFEAGTGVGKSFAYLIPAMLYASENDERVIISTGTINLQSQLCDKDIPMVEKIIGNDVKFLLMKGRNNYVCLRRFNDALKDKELFTGDTLELKRIESEVNRANYENRNSPEGIPKLVSKSDLDFLPTPTTWGRINSESENCMGRMCPYHEECFITKLKKVAEKTPIIVVNHHLLFADIDSRLNSGDYESSNVLPAYKRVIFDEAHTIEGAATSFFSGSFNRLAIERLITEMYRRTSNSVKGTFFTVAQLSGFSETIETFIEKTEMLTRKIYEKTEKLSEVANVLLGKEAMTKRLVRGENYDDFLASSDELGKSIGAFTEYVREVLDSVTDENKNESVVWEVKSTVKKLEGIGSLASDFANWEKEIESSVFWLERRNTRKVVRQAGRVSVKLDALINFNSTPLEIASKMNRGVLSVLDSVVFTSATLKTGRSFEFWGRNVGTSLVKDREVDYEEYPSPFPYKENMLVSIPKDAPDCRDKNFQEWLEKAIIRLIRATKGRTLVLFTSYESLRSAYKAVKKELESEYNIFSQGLDDNGRLLKSFKEDVSSILFATDSFWQGIDVKGESLSQVIITKLPFAVPTDPIFQAKSEEIERHGGNSFMELSIPDALTKFRQGAGRLIRSVDDRGVLSIMDSRVITKRYGRLFLESIPESRYQVGVLDDLLEKIESFIGEK